MLRSHKGLRRGTLLLAAILLGSSVTHAQQTQPQQGMMGHGMMGRGMMGSMGMMSGPMLEGRLAYMKAELAITEAQSAAWDAYVGAVKTRTSGMKGMQDTTMQAMHSGSPTARMDAHIKAMESMTEALKALKPATEALYAVLTPEQKQKADQLLGSGCMM